MGPHPRVNRKGVPVVEIVQHGSGQDQPFGPVLDPVGRAVPRRRSSSTSGSADLGTDKGLVELLVQPAAVAQLLVGAPLDDPAVVKNEDLIGVRDG